MKKLVSLSIAVSFAFAVANVMGENGFTDPVGFVRTPVGGNASVSQWRLSILAPVFVRPLVWEGTITSISSNTVTVGGNPWTAGQFNGANGEFYVEIYSATKAGVLSDIVSTVTNSITLADDLTWYATVGDSIRIRPHTTLNQYLGANNSFGLTASNSPVTADEVLIYDGAHSVSYFYFTGDNFGDPPGWYDSAFTFQAGDVVISPHEGVIIKRKATENLPIISMGAVKTGATLFPVYTGLNVLSTLSPVGLTLDSSGLYSGTLGLTASYDIAFADEVLAYQNQNGLVATSYWYYDGSLGFDAGWYDAMGTPSGLAPITGTAFVIQRKGAPLNWVVPAPTMQSFVQSSGPPNAGLTLAQGPTAGGFALSWWAIAGNTYFVQQSSDLVTWEVLPVMESVSGSDQVISWGFNSTADKLFLRLRYTDIPTTDPANTAFAGDGMTTVWKLRNGLDPLVWLDPSGDADGDGISNSLEFQNNTNALKPAPVLTLTVPAGATLVP